MEGGEGKENHIQEKVYAKGSWYSCQRLCAKTLLERVNENVEFPCCDGQNAMQSTSLTWFLPSTGIQPTSTAPLQTHTSP